jgi:peptide/nickel transport system permease protein
MRLFGELVRGNPLYVFSLVLVILYLAYSSIVLMYPAVIPYNPTSINLVAALVPPSSSYPFGTDELGRNLILRVLYGAPLDAEVAVAVGLFGFAIGMLMGSIAGYFGGFIDQTIMRITDIFLAFPGLVLAVAVAAALGPGLMNALIAMAVVWWPVYTRIARGETLSVKEQQFVLAAKASGVSRIKIVTSHILSNVAAPTIAYATSDIGNIMITFSVLGYLGLGAQPPYADLGRIVYDGQPFVRFAPWYALLPGITLFAIVLSFTFVGDLIRDFLDPRLRRI